MGSLDFDEAVKLLKKHDFSDFTIKCGNQATFHVHKALIAAKSEFLEACVKGNFREGLENELIIQETTPLAVASLLLYIYSGTYDLDKIVEIWPELKPIPKVLSNAAFLGKRKRSEMESKQSRGDVTIAEDQDRPAISQRKMDLEEIRCHMRLYELADRFLMPGLKDAAIEAVIDLMNCWCLGWSCAEDPNIDMDDLPLILNEVQTNTGCNDDCLRPTILAFCLASIGCLTSDVKEAVEKSIKRSDPLLLNFGMKLAKELKKTHTFYMEEAKRQVKRAINAQVVGFGKGAFKLDDVVVDEAFEAAEDIEWEPF